MSAPAPPVFFAVLPEPAAGTPPAPGGVFSPFRRPPAPLDFSAPTRAGRGAFDKQTGRARALPCNFIACPLLLRLRPSAAPKRVAGMKKQPAAVFCCCATKNDLSQWPWLEDGPHGRKNSRYAAVFYSAFPPPFLRAWASSFSNVSSLISCSMRQASSAAVFSLTPSRTKNSVSSLWRS